MLAILCALTFLGGCERGSSAAARPFDGERALGYVAAFMQLGPRIPGTDSHRRAGDWIAQQMRQRSDTVIEQRWTYVTAKGDTLPLRNILARYRPAATERILYVTHWDSRPVSEEARDPVKQKLPVPGANDGGSGVGLFLALGDLLKATPPSTGVDLLFVDGEDYGVWGPPDVDVLLGSTYFASHLPSPDYQILFGVVWDMIGDKDLQIFEEQHSLDKAPEVVSRVWEAAAELGYANIFHAQPRYLITDDHLPLQDKGLRVIDVIDLDYQPYHHTPEDTMDKISAQSLKVVGDVAWRVLQQQGG